VLQLKDINEGDEIVATDTVPNCLVPGQTYKVERNIHGLYVTCRDHSEQYGHPLVEHRVPLHFKRFIQNKGGWIGVDLDGTLAVYDKWQGPYHIGEPIPLMVERVKKWLAEGRDVRIFTARVTDKTHNNDGTEHVIYKVVEAINRFCLAQFDRCLPVTNIKDWDMMELWDDRAIQVRPNTGVSLAEELTAIRNAEAAPKYPG
jgi:hypothetical protein